MNMHLRKVEAAFVTVRPPTGKQRMVEQFCTEVEEGAEATEAQCPKDTLY